MYNTKYTLWTLDYSEKIVFFNSQWKTSKPVSVELNNGGTPVDSDILNKNLPKRIVDWKQDSLFNMIYFLLEKVIRCPQMHVDCLRASTGDSRIYLTSNRVSTEKIKSKPNLYFNDFSTLSLLPRSNDDFTTHGQ